MMSAWDVVVDVEMCSRLGLFALSTADRKCSARGNLGGFSAGGCIAKADIFSADLLHVAFQSSLSFIIKPATSLV
jgi:hypothetical protein